MGLENTQGTREGLQQKLTNRQRADSDMLRKTTLLREALKVHTGKKTAQEAIEALQEEALQEEADRTQMQTKADQGKKA